MDNETIYRQNGNSFESSRTSSLNLKDEKDNVIATLVDTRIGAKNRTGTKYRNISGFG